MCVWSAHNESKWLAATWHLDDLHQLVHAAVPGEDGLAQEQLGQHAARRPDVDVGRVVGGAEDELGGAVVPRADVRDVGLAADQLLGTEWGKDGENAYSQDSTRLQRSPVRTHDWIWAKNNELIVKLHLYTINQWLTIGY